MTPRSNSMIPFRSNFQEIEPLSPSVPPRLSKIVRSSEAVRFRLSVTTSMTWTPPRTDPLVGQLLDDASLELADAFLTALSMESLGIDSARAASMA